MEGRLVAGNYFGTVNFINSVSKELIPLLKLF